MVGLVTALAFFSAGCQKSVESRRTLLRISTWNGAGDGGDSARIEREIYQEFERRNPDIEVQLENIPGSQDYVRKLLLSFVAGSEPDVIKLDASSAAVFIDNGALRDLAPIATSDPAFSWDDYFPNVSEIARRGAALYAVPIDFTPIALYYNKRLFDEARVPYPAPGWTWDDFVDRARRLTKPSSKGEGQFGFVLSNWMPGWLTWVWNNQGDVLSASKQSEGTADSGQTVAAVSFLRDLIVKEKVSPSLSQLAAEGAAPFVNANAAMEISGHWNLTTLANAPKIKLAEVGIAPLPVSRRGQAPVTVIYESGWAIGKDCKHPQAAWKFIRYFTSAEVQRKLQTTGVGICARKDISRERATTEVEKNFLSIVPSGRPPWGAQIETYDYVESEGQKMMDSVLKSGADPAAALQEFATKVDRQLGRK